MRFCLIILIGLISVKSEIIPAARRATWQGNVGVPGGIPHYEVIAAELSPDADGTVNVENIKAALLAAQDQSVVKLKNGNWPIASQIDFFGVTNRVVLRGNGLHRTKLTFSSGNIYMRNDIYCESCFGVATNLSANSVKGSNVLHIATGVPSWVRTNELYLVDQVDDGYYASDYGQEGNGTIRKNNFGVTPLGTFSSTTEGWVTTNSPVGSSVAWESNFTAFPGTGSLKFIANFANDTNLFQEASVTVGLPAAVDAGTKLSDVYYYVRVAAGSSNDIAGHYGNVQAILQNGAGLSAAPLRFNTNSAANAAGFWWYNDLVPSVATNTINDVRALTIRFWSSNYTGPITVYLDEVYLIASRGMGTIVKVIAKTATNVTTEIPLFWPWQTNRTAQLVMSAYNPTNQTHLKYCGIEDLSIEATYANGDVDFIKMENTEGCWIKNVSGYNQPGRNFIVTFQCYRFEVRDCFFDLSHAYGPGQGYGINIYAQSVGGLVENNIVKRSHVGISCNYGSAGNVIAYNYVFNEFADQPQAYSLGTHAIHCFFNLFEGNVTDSKYASDMTHGSGSHQTVFRNRIKGTAFGGLFDQTAVLIEKENREVNVVGNVLGVVGVHTNFMFAPATNYYPGYDNLPVWAGCDAVVETIFKVGYFGSFQCGNDGYPDYYSVSLPIIHGNWDSAYATQKFDPAITDHVLLNSYYLTSKPPVTWWPASMTWPPVNPSSIDASNIDLITIPAKVRYEAEFVPPTYVTIRPKGKLSLRHPRIKQF